MCWCYRRRMRRCFCSCCCCYCFWRWWWWWENIPMTRWRRKSIISTERKKEEEETTRRLLATAIATAWQTATNNKKESYMLSHLVTGDKKNRLKMCQPDKVWMWKWALILFFPAYYLLYIPKFLRYPFPAMKTHRWQQVLTVNVLPR